LLNFPWYKLWIFTISSLVAFLLFELPAGLAQVWLPSIFADNMVLQRDKPIAIWGTATPGLPVKIKLGCNQIVVTPDINSNWSAKLPAMSAGGPYELSIGGDSGITFHNVAIGDVWLCAGQSNMKLCIGQVFHSKKDIETAQYPMLRFFEVTPRPAINPEKVIYGKWRPACPLTVPRFSAVSYYFAREIHLNTKVPIGIIVANSGGSIGFWMSKDSIAGIRKDIKDNYPSITFNGMIAPIIGYGIKGMIWYKGETDIFDAHDFEGLISRMIQDWRQKWNLGNFPCLCVQLPNYPNRCNFSIDSTVAQIREAQLKCSKSIPNFHLIVTIDTAEEAGQLHPKNKLEIGHRLAQKCLAKIYGRNLNTDYLSYESTQILGNKISIHFPNEVIVKGGEINSFVVASMDKVFYPAKAELSKNKTDVIVWNNKVAHPTAVRYAWADNPKCNLYGKNNLPVSPFRTDSWPSFGPRDLEGQTASYWLSKAYLTARRQPDIVILGNDQLFALQGADALVYHKLVDLTGDHRSCILESNLQALLNKHWQVLVGALPKAMVSDQLVVSHALFSNQHKPKLVAIALSPGNFIDTDCPSIIASEPFTFFSKNTDFGSDLDLFSSDQKWHSGWRLCLISFSNMLKQIFDLQSPNYNPSNHCDFKNFSPLAWGDSFQHVCPGSFVINAKDGCVFNDNLQEYQRRYKHPFSPQLKLQLRCLNALLSYLAQQQIKVVVFDLPLTTSNRKLLPDSFWQFYNQQISQMCKENDADWININDLQTFTDKDFMDSVHLNLPGGQRLTTTLALYIANKFNRKIFAELQHNESKTLKTHSSSKTNFG